MAKKRMYGGAVGENMDANIPHKSKGGEMNAHLNERAKKMLDSGSDHKKGVPCRAAGGGIGGHEKVRRDSMKMNAKGMSSMRKGVPDLN